jgi:putative oxidoreductase
MEARGVVAVAARVAMSLLFFVSGVLKLAQPGAMQHYMTAYGVPAVLLWPAAAWELVAGILLLAGLWAGPVLIGLAGWCLLTAAIFHTAFGDPNQLMNFFKNVVMAGGFVSLALAEPRQ